MVLENACYHLMIRGNQKQKVFKNESDYLAYLALLKRFKRKYKFKLYAFCLMPNHVHLLGQIDNPPYLSKFMHGINRTYTLYFNHKYKKVGHLWQGRYKSKIISKDRYLFDCINYIESNPIRSGLTSGLMEYAWNSYRDRALKPTSGRLDELYIE